jgi:hypothetical protein
MERIGAVSIRLNLWIDGYPVQQWGHGGDTNLGQASVLSSANDGSRTRLRRGNVTKIVLSGSLPHRGRWSFVISMDDGGISITYCNTAFHTADRTQGPSKAAPSHSPSSGLVGRPSSGDAVHDDHVVRINTEQDPPLATRSQNSAGCRCARLLQRPVREAMFPLGRERD